MFFTMCLFVLHDVVPFHKRLFNVRIIYYNLSLQFFERPGTPSF